MKTTHEIGCILESYAHTIRNRGYEEEAEKLENIASKLKQVQDDKIETS